MVRETVSNTATPKVPARAPGVGPNAEQASKDAQAYERIAQRAYELYEQRGRQDGRALEDWVNAEQQLVGASSK